MMDFIFSNTLARHLARGALLVLVACVTACGPSFQASTPPGFVELDEDSSYDYRATTADGLVIAVREVDHEPTGELTFWSRAIENELRYRGGYALLQKKDVRTKSGLSGVQLRFGHDEGSVPHLYYVTLFLTDDTLYLLEAGGSKELVEQYQKQIDWAIDSFRAD